MYPFIMEIEMEPVIDLSYLYIPQSEIDQLQHWIDMLEAEYQDERINAILSDEQHEKNYNRAA